MANRYAQIDGAGVVVSQTDLSRPVDHPSMIAIAADAEVLGKRWDGAAFVPVPVPPGRVYTKLAWLDAIGDAAAMQIMLATDPVIRLIDRKFQAATEIDTEHAATQQAFGYLVESAEVPAFTAATVDALRGVA